MRYDKTSILLVISGLYGFLGVILGAFGAHALHDRLVAAAKLNVWETAVDYQLVHALALGMLAILAMVRPVKVFYLLIGAFWTLGVLLFSGSLYWLALDGPGWLGPITPIGGLLLISGWFFLGVLGVIGLKRNSD